MEKIDAIIENNLKRMNEELALHESCQMKNEGVFIEEVDEEPVKKSFNETMKDLLKDFSK